MKSTRHLTLLVPPIAAVALVILGACGSPANRAPEVVVYVSVDQVHAEPILNDFAEQTGMRVKPVYDVEASKTTGLVQRLIAEKERPQADVFWNGEFAQTLRLKGLGVLARHRTPAVGQLCGLLRISLRSPEIALSAPSAGRGKGRAVGSLTGISSH